MGIKAEASTGPRRKAGLLIRSNDLQKNVLASNGQQQQCNYDRIPDTCPVCNTASSPIDTGVGFIGAGVQFVFRCPRHTCGAFFIAYYRRIPQTGHYVLDDLKPRTHRASVKSEEISNLSPSFIKIVNQAETAETSGLDEIAGALATT